MTPCVLIVDDSLTVRMDLREAFEAAGLRPVPCATATEARLALAREHVDVVVLDVMLPDADGVEFAAELRARPDTATTVILMLSTEADVKDRIRGVHGGADEYVGKPYDAHYVVAKARQLLGSRDPRAATVLVIDDSPTARETLRDTLTDAGYTVATAADGEEGLRLAAALRPVAVVVDGSLPGIDGTTVIRRLRLDAALRDVPCLLLTASTERDAELQVLDAGADAFIRKEDDLALVLAKLAAILRQSTGAVTEDDARSLHSPTKILAVDDSLTYLQGIGGSLREDGYEVVLAHSGEEALDLLAAQTVDCILLDLLMPGIDGHETCQRIKATPAVRDIPLIMMTALDDTNAMLDGLSAGADDYIQKTADPTILKARVRAQIRRKQFQDENRRIRDQLVHKEIEAAQARAAHAVAEARAALADELEWKNRELEAFGYSVSHDLRNPLNIVDALVNLLIEDYAGILDATARHHLDRIRAAAARMSDLINALLRLSQASRAELTREPFDLAEIARDVTEELRSAQPHRTADFRIEQHLLVHADPHLVRILLDNLLGNAWKFTMRTAEALIEVGAQYTAGGTAYFIRDNGAGFNHHNPDELFHPFGRAHSDSDFPGTGIGLATVNRIIERHQGRIWAEGAPGAGATFYFTLAAG
ncbi:MAG: two-component system, NtrC family, sensor kinase [Micromonosporaceae bacterium]